MFVIAGVSGNTGSIVANALLEQGKKVRVIVRDAKKGEPWKARGAEVAVATRRRRGRAHEGARGRDRRLFPLAARYGATDFIAERRASVETLARAVEKSKVPHVVLLSSMGAQHEAGTGPIRTLHFAEQRLAKTPAKTTFVRAAYFLENWASVLGAAAQGKLPTFLPAGPRRADGGDEGHRPRRGEGAARAACRQERHHRARRPARLLLTRHRRGADQDPRQAGRGRGCPARGGRADVHELRHQPQRRRALPGDVRRHREGPRRIRGQGSAPRPRSSRRRNSPPRPRRRTRARSSLGCSATLAARADDARAPRRRR